MSIQKENKKKTRGDTIKYPSNRNQNNDLTFNDIQFRYSQKKVYGYFGEYSIANKIFTQLSSSKNVHGPILLFYIFTTPFIFCQFSTFIHWVILHQVHQNWKLLQETMNSSRIDWFEGHWCGSTNMVVRMSDLSSKTGKKCIFVVFRPFVSLCQTASQP